MSLWLPFISSKPTKSIWNCKAQNISSHWDYPNNIYLCPVFVTNNLVELNGSESSFPSYFASNHPRLHQKKKKKKSLTKNRHQQIIIFGTESVMIVIDTKVNWISSETTKIEWQSQRRTSSIKHLMDPQEQLKILAWLYLCYNVGKTN